MASSHRPESRAALTRVVTGPGRAASSTRRRTASSAEAGRPSLLRQRRVPLEALLAVDPVIDKEADRLAVVVGTAVAAFEIDGRRNGA